MKRISGGGDQPRRRNSNTERPLRCNGLFFWLYGKLYPGRPMSPGPDAETGGSRIRPQSHQMTPGSKVILIPMIPPDLRILQIFIKGKRTEYG